MTFLGYGTVGVHARRVRDMRSPAERRYPPTLLYAVACRRFVDGTDDDRRDVLHLAGWDGTKITPYLVSKATALYRIWEDARQRGLPVPQPWAKLNPREG